MPTNNPIGNKIFLAIGVKRFFIIGKPAVINGLRKFGNPSSWLIIFLVVPFNKIPLFSKDLTTFIKSFILLFVRVTPKPVIEEIPFLIFLQSKLSYVSIKASLFSFFAPAFFINEFIIGRSNLSGVFVSTGILGGANINLPAFTILDN